ncbi:MAG TPA: ABC-type transport auxiliary lipoprotein family protein [Xanthobacteraceae bacterium]|nr:ABC-type transport auxiliary lipoprotein family protein [Xanthobacteraceae bacterium]
MGAALLVGLSGCALLGGGAAPSPAYDLTAPHDFGTGFRGSRGQLIVTEPTALAVLDSDKIVVRAPSGEIATAGGAQWRDRLPKLMQERIVQTFENAHRMRGVGVPANNLTGDYQLIIDIRRFEISVTNTPVAEVEFTAKIVSGQTGRIVSANVFHASAPATSAEGQAAAFALDAAFGKAVVGLVRWAARLV